MQFVYKKRVYKKHAVENKVKEFSQQDYLRGLILFDSNEGLFFYLDDGNSREENHLEIGVRNVFEF